MGCPRLRPESRRDVSQPHRPEEPTARGRGRSFILTHLIQPRGRVGRSSVAQQDAPNPIPDARIRFHPNRTATFPKRPAFPRRQNPNFRSTDRQTKVAQDFRLPESRDRDGRPTPPSRSSPDSAACRRRTRAHTASDGQNSSTDFYRAPPPAVHRSGVPIGNSRTARAMSQFVSRSPPRLSCSRRWSGMLVPCKP
jgi:hypothetical protein